MTRLRSLSHLGARELGPLLQEEVEHWAGSLAWDFSEVAAAVASGVDRHSLSGYFVEDGARPVAYGYYMLDAGRAIIGSLFASAAYREQGLEERLLDALIDDARSEPDSERVECQTLFCTAGAVDARFARAGFVGRPREYLLRDLSQPLPQVPPGARLRPLRRDDVALAARLIHRSHVGSLDAALNRTYSTPRHCHGFVETIVLRAGCGRFDPRASFVAEAEEGPVGVLLASHLSRTNGHICQVSVLPEAQGRGLGALLLASSLEALRDHGLASASLSVTVGNRRAYALYERFGFRVHRAFGAHAWVRPPARLELAD